jgi:hypothetical protein
MKYLSTAVIIFDDVSYIAVTLARGGRHGGALL